MKLIVTILFLFLATTSLPQTNQALLRKQLAELKALQKAEFDKVIGDLAESRNTANGLHDNLKQAQSQLNVVGKERDDWKDYGEDRNERWLSAEKRVAEEKVKKQRWVMMFSSLAILVALYFGLKFFTPLGKLIP